MESLGWETSSQVKGLYDPVLDLSNRAMNPEGERSQLFSDAVSFYIARSKITSLGNSAF